MTTHREIILQEMNEERFSRKHIDAKIRKAIDENPAMQAKLQQGVQLVQDYMAGTYYASKMVRIAQLQDMDIPAMVMDLFVGVAYSQRPELLTSVTAQMSSRLKLSDRTEAITTVAELLAVLCNTDAFDIQKTSRQDSLELVSRIPLPETLVTFIENSQFLPPMVCEPLELTHNFSSGYLTHNDSLILGSGNHHDGDICLDVLNKLGKVALKLDLDFLSQVEEDRAAVLMTEPEYRVWVYIKKQYKQFPTYQSYVDRTTEQWKAFKEQSYMFYSLMAQQGNRFYLNHKVDKRGRIYAHGYHITTQGTAFKKAMIELANEELVTGVPT